MNTATAKVGDRIEFVTTQGVLIGHDVVVPGGAKAIAEVEEVQRGGAAGTSLRIAIRELAWQGGNASLNAVVISVEPSDVSTNPLWRHLRRAAAGAPTMLEHINVRSHIDREAFVEFESGRGDFVLRPGVRLVLWQIDPERGPSMFARNPVLEVRSESK